MTNYRINEFAKRLGRSAQTIRRWEREGRLTAKRLPSGQRYFDESDVRLLIGGAVDKKEIVVYEIECIRGNWSVRALKRQISSLYFERSGLSLDKDKLSTMAHAAAEKAEPRLAIRDDGSFSRTIAWL